MAGAKPPEDVPPNTNPSRKGRNISRVMPRADPNGTREQRRLYKKLGEKLPGEPTDTDPKKKEKKKRRK